MLKPQGVFEMVAPDVAKPHPSLLQPHEIGRKMIAEPDLIREIRSIRLKEFSVLSDGTTGIGFEYLEQIF